MATQQMSRCKSPKSFIAMACKRIFFFLLIWHCTWSYNLQKFSKLPLLPPMFMHERKSYIFLLCCNTHARLDEDSGWWYLGAYYTYDGQVAKRVWHHNHILHPCWSHGKRRKSSRVATKATLVVEEKIALTLLLILLLFLCLYYNHNRNTKKEK